MPFGLKNAPATFQRLMDIVLKGTTDFCRWIDISIFSLTWDTHIEHLRTVLTRLQSSVLTLQLPKCLFEAKTCEFLGHKIGPGYISPQQAKVDAVANFARPVRKKDIRSFLGLAGYYHRYIPWFSCIAAPLSDLTRIQGPDTREWTPECQQAFESLKQGISSQPTLALPDYSKLFLLQTDASDRGIGAVLSQTTDQGDHPIAFYSRKFFNREQRYTTMEQEGLALLPARASEQGNVIGSVRIYICVQKKIVIERTRDLIFCSDRLLPENN